MSSLNYYQLLDVNPTASEAEIKIAFRKKILQVHIDKGQKDSDLCYKTIAAYNVLSNKNSRIKYDISLENPTNQVFPTAGAICYDVENQYSKLIAEKIKKWESENVCVKNNYFESFSNLFSQVLDVKSSNNNNDDDIFNCKLCMKSYLNEEHHWKSIIKPYIDFLTVDINENLYDYLSKNLIWFCFNVKQLPKTPEGIWDKNNWKRFYQIIKESQNIITQIPCKLNFEDKLIALKKLNKFKTLELDFLKGNDEEMVRKCNKCFVDNNIEELLMFSTILEEFTELKVLINCCVDLKFLELAVFWELYLYLTSCKYNWYELGMKIVKLDTLLAHYCFIFGGYTMEFIGDQLTYNGDFAEALDFYLNDENPMELLQKKAEEQNCELYKTIFNSLRARKITENLLIDYSAEDVGELIEICNSLLEEQNLFTFYKIITSKYVEKLNSLEFYEIHRYITYSKDINNFEDLNLLLAAYHFLPNTEFNSIYYKDLNNRFTRSELKKCVNNFDFDTLTKVLLNLNGYNITIIEEMCNTETAAGANGGGPTSLLVQATVNKFKGNYLSAMTEYQNVLLNSPEIIYRLIPIVSILTQDELFTHSIQKLVLGEVQDFKELLEYGEYIDGGSLILTETTPTDFGYKDMTSKVNTIDPEVMRESRVTKNEDEQPANTPQITITKNEAAIEQVTSTATDEWLIKAYSYMDLIQSIPKKFHNGPIVMAASHLLKAMDETIELNKLIAYRNAIFELGCELFKLFEETGSNVQCCTSQKTMFSILVLANQKLSSNCENFNDEKVDALKNNDNNVAEGLNKEFNNKTELIPPTQELLISQYLKNIVNFPKVEPLINLPTLNCSDLQYVETIWTQFIVQYCRDKLKVTPNIEAASALCNEIQHGRSGGGIDLNEIKLKLMEALLTNQGWTFFDVEKLIVPYFCSVDDSGWINHSIWNDFEESETFCIHGFQINYTNLEIQLLTSKHKRLINNEDLVQIFENGIENFSLTFDNIGQHPFKEITNPPCLNSTEFLKTIIYILNIINSITTGSEFNTIAPFCSRNFDISNLPEHLQHFCNLLRTDNKTNIELNVNAIYYEEVEDDEMYIYKIGNVELGTKCQYLLNVVKHFHEFSKFYPEFARVMELIKAACIRKKLRQMLVDYSFMIKQNGKSSDEIKRLEQLCKNIRHFGIGVDLDEKKSCCNWIPSSDKNTFEFNFNVDPIYGPVDDARFQLTGLNRSQSFNLNIQFNLPSKRIKFEDSSWWAHCKDEDKSESYYGDENTGWCYFQKTQELYYKDTLVHKTVKATRQEPKNKNYKRFGEHKRDENSDEFSSLGMSENSETTNPSDSFTEIFKRQTNVMVTKYHDESTDSDSDDTTTYSESEFSEDLDNSDSEEFNLVFKSQRNYVTKGEFPPTNKSDSESTEFSEDVTTNSQDFSSQFRLQKNFTIEKLDLDEGQSEYEDDSFDSNSNVSDAGTPHTEDFSLLFRQQNNVSKLAIQGLNEDTSDASESSSGTYGDDGDFTGTELSDEEFINTDQQDFIQTFSNKYFEIISREESINTDQQQFIKNFGKKYFEIINREELEKRSCQLMQQLEDVMSLDDISSIPDETDTNEVVPDYYKLYFSDEFTTSESECSRNVNSKIAPGTYVLSKPYTDPIKGPLTIKLSKDDDCIFFIHGMNKYFKSSQDVSLLFPFNVRKRICLSREKTFKVEE